MQKESKIAREEGSVGAYGWTGRRTARVAHKRAGRRLRLQGDLERLPTLRGLCVPCALRWRPCGGDTKRRIWCAPCRCIWMFLSTPCPRRTLWLLFRGVHRGRVCCPRPRQRKRQQKCTALEQTSWPGRPKQPLRTGGPWQRWAARSLFGRSASWQGLIAV